MMQTATTIISIAFAAAIFSWSQVRVRAADERSEELFTRLSSVTSMCVNVPEKIKSVMAENRHMKIQIEIFEQNRLGRKQHIAQLKKLIKKRNMKYGIGGNL